MSVSNRDAKLLMAIVDLDPIAVASTGTHLVVLTRPSPYLGHLMGLIGEPDRTGQGAMDESIAVWIWELVDPEPGRTEPEQ